MFCLLGLFSKSIGQTTPYEPLVIEDARWRVQYHYDHLTDSVCCWLREFWIHGDTILDAVRVVRYEFDDSACVQIVVDSIANQVPYKILWQRDLFITFNPDNPYIPLQFPRIHGFIREDTSSRMVFCYDCLPNYTDSAEELLYDFSIESGIWYGLHYLSIGILGFEIDTIYWRQKYGKSRKTFLTSNNDVELYEGIGSDRGLLEDIGLFLHGPYFSDPTLEDYCIGDDSTCGVFPYIMGLPEQIASDSWDIYPNPATEQIQVIMRSWQGSLHDFRLVIRDLTGRKLMTQTILNSSFEIDLQNIPSGIYVCELLYKNHLETVLIY
ncbi:MAG: T9SS type A sorting domain-containing protein [Bacteroidota bacterium]